MKTAKMWMPTQGGIHTYQKKLQDVFLIGDDTKMRHFRWTIHKAQRIGTSGRRLLVNPRCQIYPEYFDLYRPLTSLWEIAGSEDSVPSPWHFCKFCFPEAKTVSYSKDYQIASISN